MSDVSMGNREGLYVQAYPDGLFVSGWYDTYVGIEGMFLSWDDLDALKKKARRRVPFRGASTTGGETGT